jgi:histone deacetylase 11
MVPIVYHPGYNITACGLERRHPFDSVKYRRIHDELIRQGLRRPGDFRRPSHPTRAELELLHPPEYLRSLWSARTLVGILEVPVVARLPAAFTHWRVLRPMRLQTAGTILACRLALEHGLAINLGGGFHHASGRKAHGFCPYADVPTALAILHREGKIRTALVIDTDAHQGDGTAEAIRGWGWAHLLDFYEEALFPWPKVPEETGVPLPSRLGGTEYLARLRDVVPAALDAVRPDLVVCNAGSDVLEGDPLTSLRLTEAEMAERDLLVFTLARERGVPAAMVLSGGYGPGSWRAHARSIEGILARFDRETKGAAKR